jgi:ssDNA-binding Zn-finger/Zn-ribbon topoisomerase 1
LGSNYREITNPVFLIVRTNKKTDTKFLGCPNFPNCKHSDDTASTKRYKVKMKIFEIDWEDELRPY